MGEAIVITSGKGGVGKSTSVANLGPTLAMLGKKVCMIDTDMELHNLDVITGLENRVVHDLADVVEGRCGVTEALVQDKRFNELFLLPAPKTKKPHNIETGQMKQIVASLKESFDYVLIDCPAGVEQGFMVAIAGADTAFIVTTPETAAVRDADRVADLLREHGFQETKLIVNRSRTEMIKRGQMLEIDEIRTVLSMELIGVVPDDESIIESSNLGRPAALNPNFPSAIAYRNIAKRMVGEDVPFLRSEQTRKSFMMRIRMLLGAGER